MKRVPSNRIRGAAGGFRSNLGAVKLASQALWLAAGMAVVNAEPAALASDDFMSMSLDQLTSIRVDKVYGASKHEQSLSDAPSSVSIVTQDEIKKFGYQTLADVLRGVRGFYVSYDRLYGYIGVRGFNRPGDFGGRTLILINGHRLNEPLFDSAFNINDFLLDVDLIDRIEVIRGPGSTLYGNNAFFAVINVITRRGGDLKGAEVSGAVASYDTYQGRLTYGNKFKNDVELLLSGTFSDSAGRQRIHEPAFDTLDQNNGLAERRDSETFGSAFASVRYKAFSLEGGFIERNKHTPLAPYETLFNWPQPTIDSRGYASLKFNDTLGDGWQVSTRAYYDFYGLDVEYPSNVAAPGDPPEIVINKELDEAQWVGLEGQVSRLFAEQHRVALGLEARYDFSLKFKSYDISPYNLVSDFSDTATRLGLYLQDEFSIRTNLILNAGFRYDYYSTFGDTWNPRVGLIYAPWEKTTFKLLYGQAYRAPDIYEFAFENFASKPNLSLKPEHIRTYEFVVEQDLPKNLRLSLSGFLNQTDELISTADDPVDGRKYYVNLDSAETHGVEVEADFRSENGWLARASYSLQRTEDTVTGTELSNSPRHLVKGNLIAPLWADKVFAGLEIQFSSKANTIAGRITPHADSYWVANFTLFSRELVKGLEVSASLYNLFDEKYAYPASDEYLPDVIHQNGRSFRTKLTYRF